MKFIPNISDEIEPAIRLIDIDRSKGLAELLRIAKRGDRSAIVYFGLYLSEKKETVELSIPWLMLANEFGSPDAAWNLAMICREQNQVDEMKMWIDRAADLGEADAIQIKKNGYDFERISLY